MARSTVIDHKRKEIFFDGDAYKKRSTGIIYALPYEYLLTHDCFKQYSIIKEILVELFVIEGIVFDEKSKLNETDLLFVSHRWESQQDPDPTHEQFIIVRSFVCDSIVSVKVDVRALTFVGSKPKYIFYDYSCLPQNVDGKRSIQETKIFKIQLNLINFMTKYSFLKISSDDYFERAWCVFEILTSSQEVLPIRIQIIKSIVNNNLVEIIQRKPFRCSLWYIFIPFTFIFELIILLIKFVLVAVLMLCIILIMLVPIYINRANKHFLYDLELRAFLIFFDDRTINFLYPINHAKRYWDDHLVATNGEDINIIWNLLTDHFLYKGILSDHLDCDRSKIRDDFIEIII